MLQYKVDFYQLEWEQPVEGVNCKTKKYGNKQLRLVEYTKRMPPHWCEKGHYGFILAGELEIDPRRASPRPVGRPSDQQVTTPPRLNWIKTHQHVYRQN